MVSLIQHFEADFLWNVSLKILNSGVILKTFTHAIDSNIQAPHGTKIHLFNDFSVLSGHLSCLSGLIIRTYFTSKHKQKIYFYHDFINIFFFKREDLHRFQISRLSRTRKTLGPYKNCLNEGSFEYQMRRLFCVPTALVFVEK